MSVFTVASRSAPALLQGTFRRSRPFARGFSTSPSLPISPQPRLSPASLLGRAANSTLALSSPTSNRRNIILGGLVAGTVVLQAFYGSKSDFYEYRFITDKDPDDLASFYGGEEFMELFCVFPFVGTLMMRNGTFDEEGTVHTTGLPGDLQVSMVFSSEDDDETGQTVWFNKRERFKNVWGSWKAWDMVTNFGFQSLPDGRIECYHHGEYFIGNIPPISLLVKFVFQVHARWVAWATEHHINHHAFCSETDEEGEVEELSRTNIVAHMLQHHVLEDLKAMIFGSKTTDDESKSDVSFLVKDREEGLEQIAIKRRQSINRIAMDIEMDKKIPQSQIPIDVDKLDAYRKLTSSALHRHETLRTEKRISKRKKTTPPAKDS